MKLDKKIECLLECRVEVWIRKLVKMTTAGERAAMGAETARMEGKGAGGQAVDAAEAAATGRTGRTRHRRTRLPGHSRSVSRSSSSSSLSSSDEESMRRRGHHHGVEGVRTIVSNEGEAYCPNPNLRNLVSNIANISSSSL